jgi:uncharacterized protein YndB with AHSA1/START domain
MNQLTNPSSADINLKRTFKASPARLFQAWTDPAHLAQWWGPPGSKVKSVAVDLRVGGQYRIGITQPNGDTYFVAGLYEIIKPPHKLAFTWRWEQPEMDIGNSLVTIEFQEQIPSTFTEIILTHAKLPNEMAQASHREGWLGILENLNEFLTK